VTTSVTFRAPIEITGINPYVLVSSQHASTLRPGWRRPLPVIVRLNKNDDTSWRTNLMPRGDSAFYLYLHGEMRKAAGVDVGDTVSVELRVDAAYRGGPTHEVPTSFQAALNANPTAAQNWERLAPSRRKEILRYLAGLKSERAIERNVDKALRVLGGESERFMARDWTDGR
jgi:Domain of unknown function (DUF1905)/Bacteriocin-protection, YdeI or OmpD-Associated